MENLPEEIIFSALAQASDITIFREICPAHVRAAHPQNEEAGLPLCQVLAEA
jgi:hypothetical protein